MIKKVFIGQSKFFFSSNQVNDQMHICLRYIYIFFFLSFFSLVFLLTQSFFHLFGDFCVF